MIDPFENRLREAVVVIDGERVAAIRDGIRALASARESIQGTLTLVRLAHMLPVGDADRVAFCEAAGTAGISIEPHQGQLAATIAMLTMIERFAVPLAGRTLNTLTPDATAAWAIVVLHDQKRESAHPDLVVHAIHWQALAAEYLRAAGRWSGPPELAKQGSASTAPEGAEAPPAVGIPEILDYSAKLTTWLRRTSSSFKIAALEEQQDISWWLMSGQATRGAIDAPVHVAEELQRLALDPIGPPGAEELLRRALDRTLDPDEDHPVALADIASAAERPIPDTLAGISELLDSRVHSDDVEIAPYEAALRIYHELQLVEIVRPPEVA